MARPRLAPLLAAVLALAGCDDRDGDSWADKVDNCPDAANGNQLDRDGDGDGDACDPDAVVQLLLVTVATPDGVAQETAAEQLAIAADVAAYYGEVSYGNVRLEGLEHPEQAVDLAGPIAVAIAYDGFNDFAILGAAEASLVAAGIDPSAYDRTIFVVPDRFGNRTPRGFTAGFANGFRVWMRAGALGRIGPLAHELGHTFGLQHANLLQCTSAQPYDAVYTGCMAVEYLDPFDTMGWSELRGHFSGMNRMRAGFFVPSNVRTVTASGVYWLSPIERPGIDARVLAVQRSPFETLYLEYRQPIGYDAISIDFFSGAADGVQIRTDFFTRGTTALIRPGGAWSLAPGRTYDAQTFTVTTLFTVPGATAVDIQFR